MVKSRLSALYLNGFFSCRYFLNLEEIKEKKDVSRIEAEDVAKCMQELAKLKDQLLKINEEKEKVTGVKITVQRDGTEVTAVMQSVVWQFLLFVILWSTLYSLLCWSVSQLVAAFTCTAFLSGFRITAPDQRHATNSPLYPAVS